MTVIGDARGYHKKFLFAIEIDGLEVAWFTTCSSLEAEVGVVEQHEGGLIGVADTSPGKLKWTPVTLTIGATDNNELYNWWLQVVDAGANSGEPDDRYKRNLAIVQKDRDQSERRRHNITKAWPSKFVFGSWDANAEENVMEEITLVFQYAERVQA